MGNGSTTSGLAKVTQLKQGGRAPFALLQERGVGRCGFPGTQPIPFRCCFMTVPNLGRPRTTPGVTIQTVCIDVWGEWNRTTPVQGVNRQASGNLPDEGDAIPSRPASPHWSAMLSQLSGPRGEWSDKRWPVGHMDTAHGQ